MGQVESYSEKTTPIYGCLPDIPNFKDKYYNFKNVRNNENNDLLYSSDLRHKLCDVHTGIDNMSVCYAILDAIYIFGKNYNISLSTMHLFAQNKSNKYYNNSISIRNCLHSLQLIGYCTTNDYPDDYIFNELPFQTEDFNLFKFKSFKYKKVKQTFDYIKNALDNGYPIICGLSIYSSFINADDIIPMPVNTDKFINYHCVLLVGYDDTYFILRNCWGNKWATEGYCKISHDYILNSNLAKDFWIITNVS